MGAKHLAILSRSGYADDRSQGVLKDIYAQGCQVDLVQGDVASEVDVKRAVRKASASIAGIIQGAMVLRVCTNTYTASRSPRPKRSAPVLTSAPLIARFLGQTLHFDDDRGIPPDNLLKGPGYMEPTQRLSV